MRIGVDLGGTKIETIALTDRGEILARERRPSPAGDYRATVQAVADAVVALEAGLEGKGNVGVGIPGAISPANGLIKNANSTWLIGKPFDRDLAGLLGRPVRMANDANCFALSEATDGAGKGAAIVFGVILGTGVGGGLVIDGRCVAGRNAIAGEWGHNPLPWPEPAERPGPDCYCGKRGCIETFLSGPALARDHFAATGRQCTPPEIVAAAATDRDAENTLRRFDERLARALATVINVIDPDVIVLGGGLSNLDRLYTNVPALWGAHVFSDRIETKLVPPRHGDSSGVRGAAWLWPPNSGENPV
jgi:fructokinase